MKLDRVLEKTNQLEKNPFIKILDNLINENASIEARVQEILDEGYGSVKNADSVQVKEIFSVLEPEYKQYITKELSYNPSLGILVDIIIRDGNCIMSRNWFTRLYEKEFLGLKERIEGFKVFQENDFENFEEARARDYQIFWNCIKTAYFNDEEINRGAQISSEEQSILNTLAKELNLSLEEKRLIRFSILPLEKNDIDSIIKELKDLGILFYSKKYLTLYIPDEIVNLLRKIRGFEVANKYYRRVLLQLKDSEINQICKNHNLDRKAERPEKEKAILNCGISFRSMILSDIHREGVSKTQKKARISELIEKGLGLEFRQKGATARDRVDLLTKYFQELDKEDQISISLDGYSLLLQDLFELVPRSNQVLKEDFELEGDKVMNRDLLIDYNIKPQDVLELLSKEELQKFCIEKEIKSRGNIVQNILQAYQDSDNLLIENYDLLSTRDLSGLKEKGIVLKESEIGLKFEEVTKSIFTQLGFNVDEGLRAKINTKKDKADIVISIAPGEIIIIECKTKKDKEFNQYSSVSRQVKSYFDQAEKSGYRVVKTLLVAHEFSDEFIKGCELDFEISLSLLKSTSLARILEGFKESKLKTFPYKLLLRDVLLDESRIIRSLKK